jgi:branched-chain amino acid transport system ATP-binding protein
MVFWIQDMRDDLDMTVIMIEHDMSLVSAVSDRVLAMSSGRMLAMGTPGDVQRDPGVAAAYLGG